MVYSMHRNFYYMKFSRLQTKTGFSQFYFHGSMPINDFIFMDHVFLIVVFKGEKLSPIRAHVTLTTRQIQLKTLSQRFQTCPILKHSYKGVCIPSHNSLSLQLGIPYVYMAAHEMVAVLATIVNSQSHKISKILFSQLLC